MCNASALLGIAPEHLARLFKRFYHMNNARSPTLGSSGIGLTIAKAIAEAHDGHSLATSPSLDQEAAFSFTLPITPG